MTTSSSTRLDSIARVIVPAADKDRAIAFYVDKLGFELTADVAFGDGDRWVEVRPPGGGTQIALGPVMENWVSIPTGISFRAADVDALHADLTARGVDCDDVMSPGDPAPRMFFFRDDDGNTLHVAEERS